MKVGDKVRILDPKALSLHHILDAGSIVEIKEVSSKGSGLFHHRGIPWWVYADMPETWEIVDEVEPTALQEEVALKYDSDKSPLEFLRMDGIEEMCKVFEFGANKYQKNNYLKGHHVDKLTAAAIRHVLAYQGGEELDPESGLSHIGHAQACLAMLQTQKSLGTLRRDELQTQKTLGTSIDDRKE